MAQFERIKLDGYSKQMLPAATALYYQIYLFYLFNGGSLPEDYSTEGWRFILISRHMDRTQGYLEKHFPEKAEEYKRYVERFKEVYLAIIRAYDSTPPAPLILRNSPAPTLTQLASRDNDGPDPGPAVGESQRPIM